VAEVGGNGIVVCCGEGAFEITELQPENKKRMKAGDFVKGYHVRPGDRFDKQP
jgi:methionyl-tRNA formyltransferase